MSDTSTMSKANKSKAWKAKKRAAHEANVANRASLHAQKAATGDINKRAEIQRQIDAISNHA